MADFVLVHSPVTGPSTWRWVAGQLADRGHRVTVPAVPPVATSLGWAAFVGSVAALADTKGQPVLVGHSGAGPLLPIIGDRIGAAALVFVDADVPPAAGETPLVPAEFLGVLRDLAIGTRLPPWSEWFGPDTMREMIPDDRQRKIVTAELPEVPLSYFESRAPVPDGWMRTRCGYVLLSDAYTAQAERAEAAGLAGHQAARRASGPGDPPGGGRRGDPVRRRLTAGVRRARPAAGTARRQPRRPGC